MKKINYGILSTASIVPRFVAGVRESRNGYVSAIASRSKDAAAIMAQELEIPKSYGSYQELCQDVAIDVVYIAVYNQGHYEAAKLALENNKHVLLEKPFCLTKAETEQLFDLARVKKRFIMEAQKAVFLPATLKVKELIAAGKIGKVRYIQAASSHLGVDRIKWFHSLASGGGALYGSGTYPMEYSQYVLGETFKTGTGTSLMQPGESDLQCNLSLELTGGSLMTILITTLVPLASGITFYGESGSIFVPNYWKATKLTVEGQDGIKKHYEFPAVSEFAYEVNHVNQCLLEGKLESPIMTAKLTSATIGMIETLYQQWQVVK